MGTLADVLPQRNHFLPDYLPASTPFLFGACCPVHRSDTSRTPSVAEHGQPRTKASGLRSEGASSSFTRNHIEQIPLRYSCNLGTMNLESLNLDRYASHCQFSQPVVSDASFLHGDGCNDRAPPTGSPT